MMTRKKGKIESWFDEKGYGFIQPDSGEERVFVHISDVTTRDTRPEANHKVSYLTNKDSEGRKRAIVVVQLNVFAGEPIIGHSALAKKSGRGLRRLMFSLLLSSCFLTLILFLTKSGKLSVLIPILYASLSAITILVYAKDKHDAINGNWRTSEATLHLLELAGGWPGALIAQQLFNHKRSKTSFLIAYWLMVILNCGVLTWLFISDKKNEAWQFSEQIITLLRNIIN
jgi:uncharacterized membrane protein YsdA (DUF1294 family)/cold shock CspA family protein